MFKGVSPSNQPSKDIAFILEKNEKNEKNETEKKTGEVFIEKGLSKDNSQVNKEKIKFLTEMKKLDLRKPMSEKKLYEEINKLINHIRLIDSLPNEVKTDPDFVKKVIKFLTKNLNSVIQNEDKLLDSTVLNVFKYFFTEFMNSKSTQQVVLEHTEALQEMGNLDSEFVVELLSKLSPELARRILNDYKTLLNLLKNYQSDEFPNQKITNMIKDALLSKGEEFGKLLNFNSPLIMKLNSEVFKDSERIKKFILEQKPKPIVKVFVACSAEVKKSLVDDPETRLILLKGIVNYDFGLFLQNYNEIMKYFKSTNFDENEILQLAKIHPYFIPQKFEKDLDYICKMISESDNPLRYALLFEPCKLDLSEDLILKAVKINPTILMIPAFTEYFTSIERLSEKLINENLCSIIYCSNYGLENYKEKMSERLNTLSDEDLEKVEKEALFLKRNLEKIENLNYSLVMKGARDLIKLLEPVLNDIKLKRKIIIGKNISFYFDKS